MSFVLCGSDRTAQGLRSFLDCLAVLRSPARAKPMCGLLRFLERAGPLLREPASVPTPPLSTPSLDPMCLEEIMHRLAEPIRSARTAGAFLNVWSVASLGRNELRNAAVLAWFLDPRGSHGLGPAVLRDLLRLAADRAGWLFFAANPSRAVVRTEDWPLGSETDRVDIAIDGDDFVVFIEVKIDAIEGSEQLARYVERAREKARVLRRPHAHVIYLSPRPPTANYSGLATVTWQDVARLLARRKRDGLAGILADQFAQHVRTLS
ncbi:PDDEXK-like family protein [Teichococcus aerofrigidensis]